MLNKVELKIIIKKDIKKLKPEQVIAVKSAKKNRMFFVLVDGKQVILDDQGYGNKNYIYDINDEREYLRMIKKLIQLEFPRSNKVWYNIISKKDYYKHKSFDEIYEDISQDYD